MSNRKAKERSDSLMDELKTCWKMDELAFSVSLMQRGQDCFTVIYGRQVRSDLNYGEAAKELGQAIMHALACDGKLDNRELGECEGGAMRQEGGA